MNEIFNIFQACQAVIANPSLRFIADDPDKYGIQYLLYAHSQANLIEGSSYEDPTRIMNFKGNGICFIPNTYDFDSCDLNLLILDTFTASLTFKACDLTFTEFMMKTKFFVKTDEIDTYSGDWEMFCPEVNCDLSDLEEGFIFKDEQTGMSYHVIDIRGDSIEYEDEYEYEDEDTDDDIEYDEDDNSYSSYSHEPYAINGHYSNASHAFYALDPFQKTRIYVETVQAKEEREKAKAEEEAAKEERKAAAKMEKELILSMKYFQAVVEGKLNKAVYTVFVKTVDEVSVVKEIQKYFSGVFYNRETNTFGDYTYEIIEIADFSMVPKGTPWTMIPGGGERTIFKKIN